MGSASRRKRSCQRLVSGKASKVLKGKTPIERDKIQSGYKLSKEEKGPYKSEGAEHKATQRARATMPESPARRARVLENLMEDEHSSEFVRKHVGAKPKELQALRGLASHVRKAMEEVSTGGGRRKTNEVRHLHKVVAAVVCGKGTKKARLMSATSRLLSIDRRQLAKGVAFRERLFENDINAMFTVQVCCLLRLSLSCCVRDVLVQRINCPPISY